MEQVECTAGAQAAQAQRTTVSSREAREERAHQAATLKSLIIKSADVVRQEMDRLATELKGSYVAQSEFGDYLERISQRIEADPGQLSQYFKFASGHPGGCGPGGGGLCLLQNRCGGIYPPGHCELRRHRAHHWHRHWPGHRTSQTGVETEQGVYDVIDKSSNMSVWTTEKLSFYIGGQETAYFSNGKLTVAQIAADRITGCGGMGRELHQRREIQMDRRMRKWPPAALSAQTQNTAHAFG